MIGVDLFSGCGGFALAQQRAGVAVAFAANHWPLAVKVHRANHPNVRHSLGDLRCFDFSTLDPFDLLTAGFACQGHSRSGQVGRANSPKVRDDHKQLRATAWAVRDCLRDCRPRRVVVENVPEILKWDELAEWQEKIRNLGYSLTRQTLTASRWGVPQRRHRVFFVGVLDGPAVSIKDPDVDEPGIGTIFDATAPGWVSISNMPKTVSKRGQPTARERVRIADDKLGGTLGWGVHVSHRGAWGRPASEPVTTLTTKAGQLWWVREGMYRLWTDGERKLAMGFPESYDLCGATKVDSAKLLGNAVPPPMAAGVIRAAMQGLR